MVLKTGYTHESNQNYTLNTVKAHYIARMRSSLLQAYHDLFDAQEKPFLYTSPRWLDATCGSDGWEAVISYDGDAPIAGLPYHKTSIRRLSAIITPPLTQWVAVIANEKVSPSIFDDLLSKLPEASIFDLTLKTVEGLHVQNDRFPVNLKYSYVLSYTEDENQVRSGYSEGLRRNLRQSENIYAIEVSEDVPVFLELCRHSYQQQNRKPPPWLEMVLPRVFSSLISNHCGMLLLATFQGKVMAGILTAWDEHFTYYLAGGRSDGDHGSSAHALLLDHAITQAHHRKTSFDFEGSMHPGIANFFQSFGASPTPYWHLKKSRGLGKVWAAFH